MLKFNIKTMNIFYKNKYLFFLFIAILAISIGYILYILKIYSDTFGSRLSSDHKVWSEFGDFLSGAVGSFLGFITILLLIITILLQIEELRATKEELKIASSQISLSRKESEKNNLLFEKQLEQAELLAYERKKN
ncbi:hypothetical protein A0128_20470 [Leptospira tipperaryensis]|uniref:Uncharacterized protein n=1 Tax=Leptospira tipperaryensis TaxID=2564040 RepID=A0A1D7V3I5_9LEPT|nr:hypothetical protein A0128_20470 [Leptospira tipperaryensis]